MTHTVVFVIDGRNVKVMPDGIIKKLKDIKEMLIERGQTAEKAQNKYERERERENSCNLTVHVKKECSLGCI